MTLQIIIIRYYVRLKNVKVSRKSKLRIQGALKYNNTCAINHIILYIIGDFFLHNISAKVIKAFVKT